jgi:hypothetical protein
MMIYVIRSGDFVKIGKANDPQKRIADLQTAHPVKLELLATLPGDKWLEKQFHNRFSDRRITGEWFRLTDEEVRTALVESRGWKPLPRTPKESRPDGEWRFEVKRKPRKASRKNAGSTAKQDWYYWVIRVHSDGRRLYYGTLADAGIQRPESTP